MDVSALSSLAKPLHAEAHAARPPRLSPREQVWRKWLEEVDAEWVRRLPLPKRSYGRHLVRSDAEAEVIACTWTKGEGTPLHGHGDSVGMTYVLEGALLEERFLPDLAGGFTHEVRRLEAGAWAQHPYGIYHRVVGASKARSLQCTVPPLKDPLAPVPDEVLPRLEAARR